MSPGSCQSFDATIDKAGINPYVDIPPEIEKAFGRRGNIPVKGSINGFPIRGTLVPTRTGRHRLYINSEMRKLAKVGVGDTVHLLIEYDAEPRVVQMPERFKEAPDGNKVAKAVFESMSPSRQKEILTYLNWLKTPEALERNVKKVIAILLRRKDGAGG